MTRTASGARVVFKINNSPVLFANAVSYTVEHNLEPLHCLDQLEPAEHYETQYTVKFTAQMFRVPTLSAASQGIIPSLQNILIRPELTATLLDKVTMLPLFTIQRIKCSSEAFEVSARDLATSTLTFVGISLVSDYKS